MRIIRHHFETIGSTNTWAKEHADAWQSDALTVITASTQTAGRGRFKRTWVSPPDVNIYVTFCFFLDLQRLDIGHVPQLLALCTAEVLEKEGFHPRLKWPNDILLSGKKVAGILSETVIQGSQRCVVCGIGVNVNMPLDICQQIDRPATSLCVEGQKPYSVEKILEALIQHFAASLSLFLKKGFESFFEGFQKRNVFKPGELVRFHDAYSVVEAFFQNLNADGSITLRLQDGTDKKFYAGEIL